MPTLHDISTTLRERGFRVTPQRITILQILQDFGGHMTPSEIFSHVQTRLPGVTEATVYRTLSFLTDEGILLAAHIGSGQLVYEMGHHEHHHLICRNCEKTVEIGDELLQSLYLSLSADTGYEIDSRHVTLFGLCPDCKNNGGGKKE